MGFIEFFLRIKLSNEYILIRRVVNLSKMGIATPVSKKNYMCAHAHIFLNLFQDLTVLLFLVVGDVLVHSEAPMVISSISKSTLYFRVPIGRVCANVRTFMSVL